MFLSIRLNQIINKLFNLINNIDYWDIEDASYKLSRVIVHMRELINLNSLGPIENQRGKIEQSKIALEKLNSTLIGRLSFASQSTAIDLLKKSRAQFKAFYMIVSENEKRDEHGELDDAYYEQFEPFVNVETGYITEEQDTEVRDACFSGISQRDNIGIEHVLENCVQKIEDLSLRHQQEYRTTVDDVDVFLSPEKAKLKSDKRIQKATTCFFSFSDKDREKILPKVQQSVQARQAAISENKHSNLQHFSSREVILTMVETIKQLKAEGNIIKKSEEYLDFSEYSSVRLAHMPSEKNLSNVFINHLGSYGYFKKQGKYDSTAVLSLFERVHELCGKNKFIEIMLQFGKNPALVTLEFCEFVNTQYNQALYRGLLRALTLVFQAEIWRYLPIDLNEQGLSDESVRNLSFAIGLAEGLELLELDLIELEDLFDTDAALGLPTGQKILQSYGKIREKQEKLQEIVQNNLIEGDESLSEFKKAHPSAKFVYSKQTYTHKLERTFGPKN